MSHSTNTHTSSIGHKNICSLSNTSNPDLKRLEIENNDLKKKVSSFAAEKKELIQSIEAETNKWKERQQKDFQHREDQMAHRMQLQMKQYEEMSTEKLNHGMKVHHETIKKQMEKQLEKQLSDQKKLFEKEIEKIKAERQAAEAQLIDQKQKAHLLENQNYEMQGKLTSLENDVKKSIKEGQMVLALSSPSPVSNETFRIDGNEAVSGKKRKTNLNQNEIIDASPASAVIENEE